MKTYWPGIEPLINCSEHTNHYTPLMWLRKQKQNVKVWSWWRKICMYLMSALFMFSHVRRHCCHQYMIRFISTYANSSRHLECFEFYSHPSTDILNTTLLDKDFSDKPQVGIFLSVQKIYSGFLDNTTEILLKIALNTNKSTFNTDYL